VETESGRGKGELTPQLGRAESWAAADATKATTARSMEDFILTEVSVIM